MYRFISLITLTLILTACGGRSPVEVSGRFNLAVVQGQDQTAQAGAPKLLEPVVGQLVQEVAANGKVRYRFELVKTAHAQTTVRGSPVPGAVVCSQTVEGNMRAFAVCTNTDALGRAVFFYEPGTKAGFQRAEIRGSLNGLPSVFDTVRATVVPGNADTLLLVNKAWLFTNNKLALRSLVVRATDSFGNILDRTPVAAAGRFGIEGDSLVSGPTEQKAAVTVSMDSKQGSVLITSVRDLRIGKFRAQGSCGPLVGISDTDGQAIDSISYDLTASEITYTTVNREPEVNVKFTGTDRRYRRNGTVTNVAVANRTLKFVRQSADSLFIFDNMSAVKNAAGVYVQIDKYCWPVMTAATAVGRHLFWVE